ncbi:MAG: translation initiation factor IF-2 subunit alpha [Nanoarchaeota archaeon]|nr:translation initiation factor IF-2 subunit alpha [Nanoarchaeota archaeon]MBU4351783.1 translation initiation factor IF-2 subunit alpha [Nanoarchaeota archaeon]MBU4456673.1 translation initiation factor IF-2 subunit alpha [Nanoarchaeota archaeon]MCG2719445.1 translation initiation factor IF-2 subunit alpha [Nanoarchaeota archaeon]
MVFKRKDYPEEGELVICTVKKVLFHSVFVKLEEFFNREGMIHISEIAPGRIRNIRDYVREGKQIVCKVLSINHERGNIDLSLRRVSIQLRLKKEDEFKQEQKAEKIIEQAAKTLKTTLADVYKNVGETVIEEHGSFSECFTEIVDKGIKVLEELKFPKDLAEEITKLVKERIKPVKVSVEGELTLESHESDGIERIKAAIKKGEDFAKKKKLEIKITYLSAPRYSLELTASNYKDAEKDIKDLVDVIVEEMKKSKGQANFKRKE